MKLYVHTPNEFELFKHSPNFLLGSVYRGVFYAGSCTKKSTAMVKSILWGFSELPNTMFLHPTHRFLKTGDKSLLTNGCINVDYEEFGQLVREHPDSGFLVLYIDSGRDGKIMINYIHCEWFEDYGKLYRQFTIDNILKDLKKK